MLKNKTLQNTLGYQFSNESLLRLALSHRSAGKDNNERLEFLGDALLDLVISDALYVQFPQAKEGMLTRSRATLVKGDTLAELAKEIGLGEYLFLGGGELKSGGHRRNSILADALEAIFGAIYLDSGLESCRKVILQLFEKRLAASDILENTKDAKTTLQEWLQGRKKPLPDYTVLEEIGSSHDKLFTVKCEVGNLCEPAVAQANSKRLAEMAAAELVLKCLQAT